MLGCTVWSLVRGRASDNDQPGPSNVCPIAHKRNVKLVGAGVHACAQADVRVNGRRGGVGGNVRQREANTKSEVRGQYKRNGTNVGHTSRHIQLTNHTSRHPNQRRCHHSQRRYRMTVPLLVQSVSLLYDTTTAPPTSGAAARFSHGVYLRTANVFLSSSPNLTPIIRVHPETGDPMISPHGWRWGPR